MNGLDLPFPTSYFYAVVTILIGVVVAVIAHFVVKWLQKKADATETLIDDIILAAIGRPLVVSILLASVYIALTSFDVIPPFMTWLFTDQVINAVYIIIGAWILSVFLDNFLGTYGKAIAEKTEGDLDDRLIHFLEIVAKYVIWFAALALLLHNFTIDITPLLAGAGIAGIALALAAQDILGNFFGGAMITFDKPFKVGDRIKVDNYLGTVETVGLRSTRILTLENQFVTVPNAKITDNIVINYSMPDERLKLRLPVSVAYGTDIAKVKKILLEVAKEAAEKTPYVLADPEPQVFFSAFAESSLDFILAIWMAKYNLPDETKDFIYCRIDDRFREEGIEIPFKQIDIRMRNGT